MEFSEFRILPFRRPDHGFPLLKLASHPMAPSRNLRANQTIFQLNGLLEAHPLYMRPWMRDASLESSIAFRKSFTLRAFAAPDPVVHTTTIDSSRPSRGSSSRILFSFDVMYTPSPLVASTVTLTIYSPPFPQTIRYFFQPCSFLSRRIPPRQIFLPPRRSSHLVLCLT